MLKPIKKYITRPVISALGKRIEQKHCSNTPVFIVGSPRSGTTLLLSILSANPNMFSIPKQTYGFDKWELVNDKYLPTRLDRFYKEFLKRPVPKHANRWIEKTPKHIQSLDKIIDYFDGNVQILHIVRDGRDVITSSHPHYLDRRYYWVSVDRWLSDVTFGLQQAKKHNNIFMVRYEDIIENYEPQIRAICDFLNEEYVTELDDWIENTRIRKSIHWGTKVQKIHSNSIYRWKKPEHEERIQELMENKEAVALLKLLKYA